jgi:hypothetical protein
MNKKFLVTCITLVMLSLIATACHLPSSGAPPPINTQAPSTPTATTAVQVLPTSTSLPPTPVVATSTPLLPTAVPPTSAPATPMPTTQTPLPPAIRIQFAAGGTSAQVEGNIDAGQTVYYVLKASATQTINVKVSSPNADVYLGVSGADGSILLGSEAEDTTFSGTLPTTQDYYLSLMDTGSATSYTLTVEFPPLPSGPTPNITPAPGAFNPNTTYGNPSFEDRMTGDNINDWVNPVTNLLPDTNYIKIAETNDKFYVTGKESEFSTWYFTWRELTDFYLQSTFTSGSCTGSDTYGMIVRGPEHLAGKAFGYVVAFTCDGALWVFRVDSANPYTAVDLVSLTPSQYILAGANKQNVMGIKFIGNTLTVYANGHQVAQVTDNKYSTGRYGLFVNAGQAGNYTYQVVNMAYWDLTP